MTEQPPPSDGRTETPPEPAPKAPLNASWIFPVGGGVIGLYFLVSGALSVRDKHGDGMFALLMAAIVIVAAVLGTWMLRTWRADRARREPS
ncbi:MULTISPECIES: hypothetical protein [Actinoplanes]|uniref:hypothetical protein n=1 Tax=Actinoplanes TaxID=1865 RepID=UPI0005F2B33B|nr:MULTISPECIES: hypothetical protein [Actinoplanes]GLY08154.1 hypothetical protein Acsp01_85330 [Actinoplanes sp. NBRC 101535]